MKKQLLNPLVPMIIKLISKVIEYLQTKFFKNKLREHQKCCEKTTFKSPSAYDYKTVSSYRVFANKVF